MGDLNLPGKRQFAANASLWKRGGAFFADFIILDLIVIGPFKARLVSASEGLKDFSSAYNILNENPGLANAVLVATTSIAILSILYFVVLEWKLKQSIGKMLFGIFVVKDFDASLKNQDEASLWQCILRSIVLLPFLPFALLWVIDPLWMLFSKKNQRLSEVLSSTRVIEYFELQG